LITIRPVPNNTDLDDEMNHLWDDARLMLLTTPFDVAAAKVLEGKLRICADRARAVSRTFSARHLDFAADDLAARIKTA